MSAVLVTGAAGFIGSHVVDTLRRRHPNRAVVSLDALTYAGNIDNLATWRNDPLHHFVHADIVDRDAVRAVFDAHPIDAVLHLAAESHVDRSLVDPMAFVRTNVEGTATLLQQARRAWGDRTDVRFVHVSTDEVFGSLGATGFFNETTPYDPKSPYSASKAAADHLVRAFGHSYGLPVVVTNCSNNYGPRQFPEKLIPLVVTRALTGGVVPVYGQGENVRDWLYVTDHAEALIDVLDRAEPHTTWCIGGDTAVNNLTLVHRLLDEVDSQTDKATGTSRALIRFVTDRPGHDFRYAIDASRIHGALGWRPTVDLGEGLRRTVAWMRNNPAWLERVTSGAYRDWERTWYGDRA